METRNGWSISKIRLGPHGRSHPMSAITTATLWKRETVGRFPKSASGLAEGRILCLRLRLTLWKRETVGRFPKSASRLSKGRILCIRSRQWLSRNGGWLVDFLNLPQAFRKAASCVFHHDSGFLEMRNGWSILKST
jgi:hypothetical protein